VANPDEVTQIARSSLLDEASDEEETKVGPAESARRAAAANRETDDELELALAEQASAEREKALRRSAPPAPAQGGEVEFQDPDDYDGPPLAHDTPSTIPIEDDDDDESTANGRGPLSGSSVAPTPAPLGGPRLPPPGAPAFGSRLPTPSTGLRPPGSPPLGLPMGNPGFSPSPSPAFGLPAGAGYMGGGSGAGYGPPAVGSSPFGARGTASSSAGVAIPAPSGLPATTRSAVWGKVQLPWIGFGMVLFAMFSLGLLVGALRWRSSGDETAAVIAAPAQPAAAQPQAAEPAPAPSPPVTAPVVQPVEPPAPPPPPAAAQDEATPEPMAAAPQHVPPPVAARPARRVSPVPGPVKATRPRKTASATPTKQVDSRGVAKGWVDPFAQ
jgi:hypothetical protein